MKAVALRCLGCGSNLSVPLNLEQITCLYCNLQQTIERGQGVMGLKRIVSSIEKVQVGTDRTAIELALRRLREEIAEVNVKRTNHERHASTFSNAADKQLGWAVIVGISAVVSFFAASWSLGVILLIVAVVLAWLSSENMKTYREIKKHLKKVLGVELRKLEEELESERATLSEIRGTRHV